RGSARRTSVLDALLAELVPPHACRRAVPRVSLRSEGDRGHASPGRERIREDGAVAETDSLGGRAPVLALHLPQEVLWRETVHLVARGNAFQRMQEIVDREVPGS